VLNRGYIVTQAYT